MTRSGVGGAVSKAVRSARAAMRQAESASKSVIGTASGFRVRSANSTLGDRVLAKYQQFYDEADVIAQSRIAAGRWPNAPMVVGARMDVIARTRLRAWLASEGIQEGPGAVVQVNRWLRDPTGGGANRIPDVRIPGSNLILDGTIGWKDARTLQLINFRAFSGGNNVVVVRPTRLGGSYGVVFP